ncbi:hypothetical protein [Paenibacillus aceris]|uniref:Uncharacterized protein n=1 Tax=Paenibacillus aceris TaxID=869555 RepID=A0ABS4I872_9BACL|nr:hypothetical protein [Paenibacillus aceris]MBP1967122.1 hypothetical protein [Paenibacillus aceris]NHW35534.1 hypothetical protein [Paenibacillus aceris]
MNKLKVLEKQSEITKFSQKIVVSVRTEKRLVSDDLIVLYQLLEEFITLMKNEEFIPKKIVSRLLLLYGLMIGQANHALDPDLLRMEAKKIYNYLERISEY